MRALARAPLWSRLVAGTLALVAIALTASGFIGASLLRGRLMKRVDQQLVQLGGTADRVSKIRDHRKILRPQGPPVRRGGRNLMFSTVLNPDGSVQSQGPEPIATTRPELPQLTAAKVAALGGKPFTVGSVNGGGPGWRMIAVPKADGSTWVFAVNLGDTENVVAGLQEINLAVGGIVLIVLGVAGYVLVRVSMRPLVRIEDTADTIAAGDLSQRVPDEDVPAEVRRLGLALNGMLAQIESAFRDREASEAAARASEDRMRRFVADASHELRTPLTSIRGFAELYRQESDGGEGMDPEAAKVLSRIEEDAARMGLLVEDLLLLARMDQQRPLDDRPVDLLSLAAEAVLDAQALAPDREIDLVRVDGSDLPVTVIGDDARLRQVLTNLINNALTHTPPGTPFRVGVGIAPGGAVLEVADEGPGLTAEQADRVFERFYRAEQSRSRAHGGSGLGLSIVAALVRAHGGRVELETAPGQGALFRVVLPVTRA